MVREVKVRAFACEVCKTPYNKRWAAVECEEQGAAAELLPEGTRFRDKSGTLYALIKRTKIIPRGHLSIYDAKYVEHDSEEVSLAVSRDNKTAELEDPVCVGLFKQAACVITLNARRVK